MKRIFHSRTPGFALQIFWSSQVDEGAAETSVQGFAGRPLRPWRQAAWHQHRGHGGSSNHLTEACRELADLPWSSQSSLAMRTEGGLLRSVKRGDCGRKGRSLLTCGKMYCWGGQWLVCVIFGLYMVQNITWLETNSLRRVKKPKLVQEIPKGSPI